MNMIMLSYFDKKLGVYSSPATIQEKADDVIIEETRRMCANPQMPKVYFEYDLYKVGVFDDKVGEIKAFEKPVFLVSLNDFIHLASEGEKEDVKVS